MSKASTRGALPTSSIIGVHGIGTDDCRDAIGSNVFECQICMARDLLGRVLTGEFNTTLLEEILPFFRFRVVALNPLAPRFDMTAARREHVVCYVSQVVSLFHIEDSQFGNRDISCLDGRLHNVYD